MPFASLDCFLISWKRSPGCLFTVFIIFSLFVKAILTNILFDVEIGFIMFLLDHWYVDQIKLISLPVSLSVQ